MCKRPDVNGYKLISQAGIHRLRGTSHSASYRTADTRWLLMTIIPSARQTTEPRSATEVWRYFQRCSCCLLLMLKWKFALKTFWRTALTFVSKSLQVRVRHAHPFGLNALIKTSSRYVSNGTAIINPSSLELELVPQSSLQFININTWDSLPGNTSN